MKRKAKAVRSDPEFDEVQINLINWTGFMSQWIGAVFDECSKRFTPQSFQSRQECDVLWRLNGSCHATGETTLLLVRNVRLWDADVLIRSVVEGTLKFVYLTLGTASERQQKFKEFAEDFGAIGQIKRHQRLKELLAGF